MKSNHFFGTLAIIFIILFSSCQKETTNDIETYADESISQIETRTNTGRGACFELVFPITISFPDQSTQEVTDYRQLKDVIVQWRKNNPNASLNNRPTFVFPISVVTHEGETVVVENEVEIRQLRRDCRRVANGFGKACFRFKYPVSIVFPDGTTSQYDSPRALKQALHSWKKENPTSTTRPQLVFPLTVTLEDGSELTLNSKEELIRLKESCK
jgi:hypothetical protein